MPGRAGRAEGRLQARPRGENGEGPPGRRGHAAAARVLMPGIHLHGPALDERQGNTRLLALLRAAAVGSGIFK